MSNNIAIKIENLSKQYRLGVIGTGTLSHDLNRWWTTSIRRKEDPFLKIGEINDPSRMGKKEYVWALKDINLEIEQGDIVGIIGKNGAGKSTLLKILSRVTKPTTGTIKYKGRIASLLEVGTGFHQEMTGRENIYMNGAIMGMTRAEITRKLEEIIDFAGVERYIDTPVKRYSSGMTVRLGFSIAAHLEPDILVVDEVLAVGDAEFQKKAIGKIQDVSKGEGRTVLFVSHNMTSIQTLCNKGVLLQNGIVLTLNTIEKTIEMYRNSLSKTLDYVTVSQGIIDLTKHPNKKVNLKTGLLEVVTSCDGQISGIFYPGCMFSMKVKVCSVNDLDFALLGFIIRGQNNEPLIGINNRHLNQRFLLKAGEIKYFCLEIEKLPLFKSGIYTVDLFFGNYNENYDIINDAFSFEIEKRDVYNSSHLLTNSINQIFVDNINYSLTP